MINRRVCRRFDPVFCKGHIKDELYLLIEYYNKYSCWHNVGNVYMNEDTYFELCSELGCNMYDRFTNTYGRIYGFNIKIDNSITPYTFEIREEDNMEIDRDSITLNVGGRQSGLTFRSYNRLPKKYILNQDACILFWSDGKKTIVKRSEDDIQDPVKGFLWAYFQKHSGLSKTKANKYLREIDEAYNSILDKED